MKNDIESWTAGNTEDFLSVVRSRFPPSALRIAHRVLANPLRSLCPECGDIAYERGIPKVVQAAVLRKLYYKQECFLGVVGGMLAAEKDASPVSIVNVMKRTIAPRGGSQIFFANTACEASLRMNQMLKVKGVGPESCAQRRFTVIRPVDFMSYVIRRKLLKLGVPHWKPGLPGLSGWTRKLGDGYTVTRHLQIDNEPFDKYWKRYVQTNQGLVSSRTGEELNWMFGDRVQSGECVLLSLGGENGMLGYIVFAASDVAARRWSVLDMIALNNKHEYISRLLKGAKCFLRQQTKAMLLEMIGFPGFIQTAIAREIPYHTSLANNFNLWKITDSGRQVQIGDLLGSSDHWFFGPYDGDMCM